MNQLALFAEAVVTRRNPICIMDRHCGHLATLGAPRDLGACVNRSIQCTQCQATGELSARKDLMREGASTGA